jgi:hypothetical protein
VSKDARGNGTTSALRARDVILALAPAAALGAFLALSRMASENSWLSRTSFLAAAGGGAAVAFYALAMVVVLVQRRRRAQELEADLEVLRRRNMLLGSQNRTLQSQVELLTAMREVSRLASDDVRFERIATNILKIVGDLVEARELTLFILQGPGQELTAQAQRSGGRTVFGPRITTVRADQALAEQAVKHRTILRSVEHELMDVLVPLVADQEPLGVLHLAVPI